MQIFPSFSADGSKLLYQSDESGFDNAWISNVDGSNARQITTTPPTCWARRRGGPTTTRSRSCRPTRPSVDEGLGNPLVRRARRQGAVLVEMPANRRDVQEPSFTPDGKFVYYTQRVIEPNIYINAMNPNYVIKRRELESGATEELMGGWGSATTPEVSHDGKKVAFIRRVKEKTVLFIYDVASRTQTPVFDRSGSRSARRLRAAECLFPALRLVPGQPAHRDLGQRQAVQRRHANQHGYRNSIPVCTPSIASPRPRISNRTRRRTRSRFDRCDNSRPRTMANVWYSPRSIGYGLSRSPAAPARLTKSAAFEFDPAFSRDGRSFAYVEWDDERGSVLKVTNGAGRNGRTVATSRGVIRKPSFSPDGKRVVYRIDEADKNMGGYGTHPGIYVVPAAGGESRYVVEGEDRPMFSPDGQRIYFIEAAKVKGELVHSLVSVHRTPARISESMRTR